MSEVIEICLQIAAAKRDEKAYQEYVEKMKHNIRFGSCLVVPCLHNPPCSEPTEEQIKEFEERLDKEEWPEYDPECDD